MAPGRLFILFSVIRLALAAQTAAPYFTRESVLPAWGKHPQSLLPNDLVAIYGRHLAPAENCVLPNGVPYPTEICGVQVTVAGVPAPLLAVLENQINLKIPAGAPTSGSAAIVVTVRGVASEAVLVPFGKPKVRLSLAGPAYIHMPVWVAVERPNAYEIAYPYSLTPGNFGGGKLEVRRNGVLLKPLETHLQNEQMSIVVGNPNASIAPPDSPRGRLPLHLQYRFDSPGKYEMRFTGTRINFEHGMEITPVDESDWTEFELLPYSTAERANWLQRRISNMPSSPGLLIGDAIPELLAEPDALALSAILPELYHPDNLVRRYTAASLSMFDAAELAKQFTKLVREKGPTEEIARILHGREDLFEGGHQAMLSALPPFLNSPSPLVQAGALQYLVWGPNQAWGKSREFQNQMGAMILPAAPSVIEHGEPRVQQLLAEALGSLKTDASRALLWKMIETHASEEQSKIALTWVGDARDLPRLAGLLTKPDPADPYGYKNASLPYSLHRAYGDASLPWLDSAARDTKQIWVRTACAKELVIANRPEGFRYLLQAIKQMPSFKPECMQFLRDRFPSLRGVSEEAVLSFLETRAQ